MEIEICIDSVEGAIAASEAGAHRVELCTALSEGGLTPSIGLIEACVKNSTAEVYVMIRPSAGGFVYTPKELELMHRDIQAVHDVGAKGVVFGLLKENRELDIKKTVLLMETALKLDLGTTFHRAIDVSLDPLKTLENLIFIGFNRVLTSGGAPSALEGLPVIQSMLEIANGKIDIMAGSGINALNVKEFTKIGVNAVHFTAKRDLKELLPIDMGPKYTVDYQKINAIFAACKA
jgi:copper homeostasis protein